MCHIFWPLLHRYDRICQSVCHTVLCYTDKTGHIYQAVILFVLSYDRTHHCHQSVTLSCVTQIRQDIYQSVCHIVCPVLWQDTSLSSVSLSHCPVLHRLDRTYISQSVILFVLCYDRTHQCHQSVCHIVLCYTAIVRHSVSHFLSFVMYTDLSHCPVLHSYSQT